MDWEKIFGEEGARWFHTGGIFCALSRDDAAGRTGGDGGGASKHGTIVSYDLNYRARCGRRIGGQAEGARGQSRAGAATST